MSTRRGTMIETFAGWGGLSLGMEQAGFDVALAVDVEPSNVAVHSRNFPYGRGIALDLSEDRTREIRAALPSADEPDAMTMGRTPDAICGGPPCQGISRIGLRLEDDPRNALMLSFVDHATSLGSRQIVMEQVPTLLQQANEGLLDALRERLLRRGYAMVDPRVLRAVDFGVPQRRERVFLLIHRLDQPAPRYPQPTHSADGFDLLLRRTPTVAEAFDALPDCDDHEELWTTDQVVAGFPHPTTWYGRVATGLENDPDDLSYRRVWRPDLLTCSQRTRHDDRSVERFSATPAGGSERVSRRHRLDPDGWALTLRAGSNAEHGSFTAVGPIHPKGTRVVTVRESCRLHSVPDWVRLSSSKITALRQIGNSVPPLLGRAVGRSVMEALGLSPAAPSDCVVPGPDSLLAVSSLRQLSESAAA